MLQEIGLGSGLVGMAIFALIAIIYLMLAFGAPLGEFVWGGNNGKVLPASLRFYSFFMAIIDFCACVIFLHKLELINIGINPRATNTIIFIIILFELLNVLEHFFSHNKRERYLMAPLSVVVAATGAVMLFVL